MKSYCITELFLQSFLNSVVESGDWQISRSDRFILRENNLVPIEYGELCGRFGVVWTVLDVSVVSLKKTQTG